MAMASCFVPPFAIVAYALAISKGVTLATPSVVVYTVLMSDSTPSRRAISVVDAWPISSDSLK